MNEFLVPVMIMVPGSGFQGTFRVGIIIPATIVMAYPSTLKPAWT